MVAHRHLMVASYYSPDDIEEVQVVVVDTEVEVDWNTLRIGVLGIVSWGNNFGFEYLQYFYS